MTRGGERGLRVDLKVGLCGERTKLETWGRRTCHGTLFPARTVGAWLGDLCVLAVVLDLVVVVVVVRDRAESLGERRFSGKLDGSRPATRRG